MDPDAVLDRAEVSRRPGPLRPGRSEGPEWVAVDPETGCRGVGDFEAAARTNLVYAVEAYRDAPGDAAPFLSAGELRTHEMRWLRDRGPTLADRLLSLLPF
ncbi:MAG: hypothetical protein ABEJ34_05650 [Haloferacaceae archaeon]